MVRDRTRTAAWPHDGDDDADDDDGDDGDGDGDGGGDDDDGDNGELKQQTFLIHGRLPEVFVLSCKLRMSRRSWVDVANGRTPCLRLSLERERKLSQNEQYLLHFSRLARFSFTYAQIGQIICLSVCYRRIFRICDRATDSRRQRVSILKLSADLPIPCSP